MKRVSFETAKAIKEASYPQKACRYQYNYEGILVDLVREGGICYGPIAPTYLEVWLWLWREKNIRFDIEDLWDAELSYPERGCASNTNQLGGICTPEVSDPEEAVVAAIEYLVKQNLLK